MWLVILWLLEHGYTRAAEIISRILVVTWRGILAFLIFGGIWYLLARGIDRMVARKALEQAGETAALRNRWRHNGKIAVLISLAIYCTGILGNKSPLFMSSHPYLDNLIRIIPPQNPDAPWLKDYPSFTRFVLDRHPEGFTSNFTDVMDQYYDLVVINRPGEGVFLQCIIPRHQVHHNPDRFEVTTVLIVDCNFDGIPDGELTIESGTVDSSNIAVFPYGNINIYSARLWNQAIPHLMTQADRELGH